MKGIAIILAGCMLFLHLGNLRENFQFSEDVTFMECCAGCSSGCCDTDGKQHENNAPCGADTDCPPACECSHQCQITAIANHFMEVTGVTVQSYHYVRYMNTYTFEYSDNFLHPPRFG